MEITTKSGTIPSQAACTASYTYDPKGFLATARDPIQRISRFEYDSVGRITKQILPDNHEKMYSYDMNGNLTSLSPPSKPAHTFEYNKVNLTEKYTPPILGTDTLTTRYQYNKDKQITHIIRPDNCVVEIVYDSVGCSTCGNPVSRPKKILFDRGELNFKYDTFTGMLDTILAPAETLSYVYDGSLIRSVTLAGMVYGTESVIYDNSYRVISQSVNSGSTINYQYDQYGHLISIGDMSITRDLATERVTETKLDFISTHLSYDSLGKVSDYEAFFEGGQVFGTNCARDSLGRIVHMVETINGETISFDYSYDVIGRLTEEWQNDTLISTYMYDGNNNRLMHITQAGSDSGIYDAQDRMIAYGNSKYFYTANGELKIKVKSTDTTQYTYDALGNLVKVIMPNGDQIEYIIDGRNRRVGKIVNGKITQRLIYAGRITPIAELDSLGNVITRFTGGYMIKQGTIYRIITDHLGSVRLIVNALTGEEIQRIRYDGFGNILFNSNEGFQPFGFAGGLYDNDTKLIHFGARDYDPEIGRWLTKDPIGFNGGEVNLYCYAFCDPINRYDQTGLQDANTWTCGEIGPYTHGPGPDYLPPEGLGDAKASIAAVCQRNVARRNCSSVDWSRSTLPEEQAAWRNVVNATGTDRSGGGNYMCVGSQECGFVHACTAFRNGRRETIERQQNLTPTGTVTVGGAGGITLYFYRDDLDGWCSDEDRRCYDRAAAHRNR
jgi:RHS repeat-associated protein